MNIYTISLARTMLKYVPPPSSASLATAVVAPMKLDNWPTNYMCIYILASVQSLVYTCIHTLMCIYAYRVWKAGPPLDQIFALKYVSLSPSLSLSFSFSLFISEFFNRFDSSSVRCYAGSGQRQIIRYAHTNTHAQTHRT